MADLTADPKPAAALRGMGVRIAAAAVLMPPVIAIIHFGTPYFEALMMVGGLIVLWEWWELTRRSLRWLCAGLVYAALPVAALIWMRHDLNYGAETIYWLIFLIWATDTGAMFAGKLIGGPKLAPRISPNKTWAGLAGGMIAASVVGIGVAMFMVKASILPLALASAVMAFIGQMGDLFESSVKRRFGAKDSGRLIPGHGGLMDRVDGLLAIALAAAAVGWLSGKGVLGWL